MQSLILPIQVKILHFLKNNTSFNYYSLPINKVVGKISLSRHIITNHTIGPARSEHKTYNIGEPRNGPNSDKN
jgi:hypothetical protein